MLLRPAYHFYVIHNSNILPPQIELPLQLHIDAYSYTLYQQYFGEIPTYGKLLMLGGVVASRSLPALRP